MPTRESGDGYEISWLGLRDNLLDFYDDYLKEPETDLNLEPDLDTAKGLLQEDLAGLLELYKKVYNAEVGFQSGPIITRKALHWELFGLSSLEDRKHILELSEALRAIAKYSFPKDQKNQLAQLLDDLSQLKPVKGPVVEVRAAARTPASIEANLTQESPSPRMWLIEGILTTVISVVVALILMIMHLTPLYVAVGLLVGGVAAGAYFGNRHLEARKLVEGVAPAAAVDATADPAPAGALVVRSPTAAPVTALVVRGPAKESISINLAAGRAAPVDAEVSKTATLPRGEGT